ncbi:MAG: methionyl-tRNA formyltransferase, partial [Clostridia bacterium]|nr:methionyl-tRNA formyltransferase [Clostridia bacterium]
KADAKVYFNATAFEVTNLINAISPSPAAYAELFGAPVNLLKAEAVEGAGSSGEVLSVDKTGAIIACGDGAVKIKIMQFAGGKALTAADVFNGRKLKAGDKFD